MHYDNCYNWFNLKMSDQGVSMIDQRIRLYFRLSYLYTHHSNTHQCDLMPTKSLLVILCWNFKLTTVSKPVPNPRHNMNTFIPYHNGKHFYNKPWNSKILLTEQCVYFNPINVNGGVLLWQIILLSPENCLLDFIEVIQAKTIFVILK